MALTDLQISIKRSIEVASRGAQTALFTPKGQLCVMNVYKKLRMMDINPEFSESVHPAFIEGNIVHDEILIATYPTSIVGGELVSQPNRNPWGMYGNYLDPFSERSIVEKTLVNQSSDDHLWYTMDQPEFNLVSGTINSLIDQVTDANYPLDGIPSPNGLVVTGSNSVRANVDGKYNGLTNPTQTLWQWGRMVRLVCSDNMGAGVGDYGVSSGMEIQVYVGDRKTLMSMDITRVRGDISLWKAIHKRTGELITPTHSGTAVQSDYVATTPNALRINVADGLKTGPYAEAVQGLPTPVIDAVNKYVLASPKTKFNTPVIFNWASLPVEAMNAGGYMCWGHGGLQINAFVNFTEYNPGSHRIVARKIIQSP